MNVLGFPDQVYRPWWLAISRRDMEIRPPPDVEYAAAVSSTGGVFVDAQGRVVVQEYS